MIEAVLTLGKGNSTIIATDSTVYSSPIRADVDVDFKVFRRVDEAKTELAISYDRATVSFIEFPVSDGWYEVGMTITNRSSGLVESSITEQYIATNALESCKQKLLTDYACHCCDSKAFLDYAKLEAALEAISMLVAQGLYKSAYCIVAAISILCKKYDCNNGC